MHQGLLTPGQQSGKARGTDAGSAELSATLETAKRCRSQVYLTSWDVRRAFDSVARGILIFSKFRAFHINWGNAHGQPASSTICIHTDDWHPVEVTLATDGSLTHLGLTRGCDLSDIIQFKELYKRTSDALFRLTSSSVSVAAKLMILKTVICPRIRYIGKGVSWAYKHTASYDKFDKLIFAAVRKITFNRPTFQPQIEPSDQPTKQPSCQPTMQPKRNPTGQPSKQPINQ